MDQKQVELLLNNAAARFEASLDKKLDGKLNPIDAKLDKLVGEIEGVKQKQGELEDRQRALEGRMDEVERKFSFMTTFTGNEAFDHREAWYNRLKAEQFRLQRSVMVFCPSEVPVGKTRLTKQGIDDALREFIRPLQLLNYLVISPVGDRSFRVTSSLVCEIEAKRFAALVLEQKTVLKDRFGAFARHEVPPEGLSLDSTARRMFAMVRKATKLPDEYYYKNYKGLIMDKSNVPLFPVFLLHPSYELSGFRDLLVAKLNEYYGKDSTTCSAFELKHGILFYEARSIFLESKAVARFVK